MTQTYTLDQTHTQIADIAQKGASVGTCSLFSAVLRMAVLKGRAACVAEAIALCPYFPAYACGAVIMWRTPQHAEVSAGWIALKLWLED